MAEKITLELEQNSPYRVAYDLAMMIARAEKKIDGGNVNGDRTYWLKLYQECVSAITFKPPLKIREDTVETSDG